MLQSVPSVSPVPSQLLLAETKPSHPLTQSQASAQPTQEITLPQESIAVQQGLQDTPIEPNSVTFGTPPAPSDETVLTQARQAVQEQFKALATEQPERFGQILDQIYGDKLTPEKRQQLVSQAQAGELPLPPNLRFVEPDVLQGNAAGYSPEQGGTVFISSDYRQNPAGLAAVLSSEVGHHIDAQLGGPDTQGDEGSMLATALRQGSELTPDQLEVGRARQDKSVIRVDSREIEVENVAPAVIGAAWWAAKVAADTAIDGALDIAIAAISGMPPPGVGSHIGNAIMNAFPILGEWNTARKALELVNVGKRSIDALNHLRRVPGAEQIATRLGSLLDEAKGAIDNLDFDRGQKLVSQFISELGDAQAIARGVSGGTLKLGGVREMAMTPIQLQSKYKHAEIFGLPKNYNLANRDQFGQALSNHIQDPNTIMIDGLYKRGNIPVTHFYNPTTGIVVMKRKDNSEMLSAWKPNPDAKEHLLTTGILWGGS